MAAHPPETRSRRIAVILGPGGSGRSLFDLLLPLLGSDRDVEMQGVFIEESEVRHAAELPFVQELCRVTFSVRDFTSEQFERALALRMRTARKALALLASRAGVPLSFRNVQGPALGLLRDTASLSDITLFEPTTALLTASPRRRQGPLRVAVVFDDTDTGRQALRAAMRLAAGHRSAVTVIATDAVAAERCWRSLFPGRPLRLVMAGRESGARGLVEAANAEGASLFVIAADDDLLQPAALRSMRERLRCPICLVRRWHEDEPAAG